MRDSKLNVAYGRLSKEDLKKNKEFSSGIYNQIGFIKSYAKTMGIEINQEYIDDGYSGINFDRPSFEKLRDDIEKGLIGVVITKDISRLGRNLAETVYYIGEYFPKHNIRYIAINDKYDSDNSDNSSQDIMLHFKSLINDKYVKDVSIKRKQVADAKTKEGQFIGFMAPYGYKIKKIDGKRTLEIDDCAADIVKRIFTEISSGKTRAEVAEGLNHDKVIPPVLYMNMTPSKKKKYYYDWTDKIIYRILKNKTYTGRIVKRKSIKKDYYQKKRDVIAIKDRETIENCHPVIISDELFELANARLKTAKTKEKNDYNGLINGLIVCGECANKMTACRIARNDRKTKVQYYFQCNKVINRKTCCNRGIADSKLKSIVKDALKNIINTYVSEEDITTRATKDLLKKERPNLKISNLQDDIALHNNNIRNLYLQKTTGKINLNEFMEKKQIESLLKEQSEKLLKEIIESKNEDLRKKELLEKYNSFINNDEFMNESIRDFIDKITIFKDNTIEICFRFWLGKPKKIKLF